MQSNDYDNINNHSNISNHPVTKGIHFDKENNNKMNNDNVEYLISFLYTEIDKLKTNSKVKVKEIIRLNKIISVLEIDIFKLQEQQKYYKDINDNHNQANYNQIMKISNKPLIKSSMSIKNK